MMQKSHETTRKQKGNLPNRRFETLSLDIINDFKHPIK